MQRNDSPDVFIVGSGSFLPGNPVANTEMENHIGKISEKRSRLGKYVQRQNGIKTRHYAMSASGAFLHTNAEMAANAVLDAFEACEFDAEKVSFLAAATTQGDYLVPGFASAVHGELQLRPMEIASFQSVCASSMMAVKSAYLQLKSGEHECAVACASEFSSRWFQPGYYQSWADDDEEISVLMETEFLRWTLSDGAGAWLLESRPNEHRRSLRIEWVDICSYADRFSNCMYAGSKNKLEEPSLPWCHYPSVVDAAHQGAVVLRQDFDLLYRMFPVWAKHYLELLEKRNLQPATIDHFLAHYSAHSLREEMKKLLSKTGAMIPEERWFTNLYTQGNTGSASIFLMLHMLLQQRNIQPGEKILCFVPESGRCTIGFMLLTVV